MNISYFKEFVVLAQTKNYWEAAELLFIGQSSLSKHIKTMEKHLGAPLFARTSRKVELTEFGKQMLPYAQTIMRVQCEYELTAYNLLHTENEQLQIALIPALLQYNIVDILLQFQLDFPNVQVNTNEEDTLVVREQLLKHECDVAIFRDSDCYLDRNIEEEAQLVKIPFCTDKLVAVLPRSHALASCEKLSLSQLKDEHFSLIKKDTMPYLLCVNACQEAGFMPHVLFNSHNLDAVFDTVTKGNCVALLFERHATFLSKGKSGADTPFVVIPIAPTIKTTLCLAHLRNVPLSKPAKHFVDYCLVQRDKMTQSQNII